MTKSILIAVVLAPAALLAQGGAPRNAPVPWMAPPGQAGPIMGKPLSGTETYQMMQTLADGTHMNSAGSGMFYRDEQGRMRSENEHTVRIYDPVAGSAYSLIIEAKAYRPMPFPANAAWYWIRTVANGGGASVSYDKNIGPGIGPNLGVAGATEAPVTTTLPAQTINGIWVTGTRTTVNIPAGGDGNNQPIQIVREQWYSSDLGVLVQSTISDPRYGTTTYSLTQIQQGAPDAALFQVPAGYIQMPTPNIPTKK